MAWCCWGVSVRRMAAVSVTPGSFVMPATIPVSFRFQILWFRFRILIPVSNLMVSIFVFSPRVSGAGIRDPGLARGARPRFPSPPEVSSCLHRFRFQLSNAVLSKFYVQRFRGGLVFKAHRLLYHSTLGLRVIKRRKSLKSCFVFLGFRVSGFVIQG